MASVIKSLLFPPESDIEDPSTRYDYIPKNLDLSKQVILITGANSGLGFATARHLLLYGPKKLIITTRDQSKGKATIEKLLADEEVKSRNPNPNIENVCLSLDSYDSVLAAVKDLKTKTTELDAVLLNAGLQAFEYIKTGEGHESTMQANVYSSAFFALELIPLLRDAASKSGSPSHLTWVSSGAQLIHLLGKQPMKPGETVIGHFDEPENYSSMSTYANSKLLVSMYTTELASRISKDEIIVTQVCPGMVRTDIAKNAPFYLQPLVELLFWKSSRSAADASNTFINALLLGKRDDHGKWFQETTHQSYKAMDVAEIMGTEEGKRIANMLWTETLAEFRKYDDNVARNLD